MNCFPVFLRATCALAILVNCLFSNNADAVLKPDTTPVVCQSYSRIGETYSCSGTFSPHTINGVMSAYKYASQNQAKITIRGAGLSFGEQCLPPTEESYLLSTENMNTIEFLPDSETEDAITLRVGAGITWRKAIDWVKKNRGIDVIPFDSPTGSDITIAGAYSAHTYSRSSNPHQRYMPDYVNKVKLIAPVGKITCSYVENGQGSYMVSGEIMPSSSPLHSLDKSTLGKICRYLPGSLGKFGVITELEIQLKKIPKDFLIESTVISDYDCLHDFIENFVAKTTDKETTNVYDHGITGILQWSDTNQFRGFLLGSSGKIFPEAPATSSFLGFNRPTFFNKCAYMLAHTCTKHQINEKGLRWYTPVGTTGTNTPFSWTFFHDNMVETRRTLARFSWTASLMHSLIGLDPALKIAHQTWFVPNDNAPLLEKFILSVWKTLEQPDFDLIKKMVLLQDLLRIPKSSHPTHITYRKGAGHVYTLTLAVHNEKEEKQAITFLQTITSQAIAMDVSPLILKENHMTDAELQQSNPPFQKIQELSTQTDPEGILTSVLWQRLQQ